MTKGKKIALIITSSALLLLAIPVTLLFLKHKKEKQLQAQSEIVMDSILMADRAQQIENDKNRKPLSPAYIDSLIAEDQKLQKVFPRAMLTETFNPRFSVLSDCATHEEGKNLSLGKIVIDCSACESTKKIHFEVGNKIVMLLNKENPAEWFFQLQMALATLKTNTVNPPFDISAALTAVTRESKLYKAFSNVDAVQPIVFNGGKIQMEKISRYDHETTLSFTVYLDPERAN